MHMVNYNIVIITNILLALALKIKINKKFALEMQRMLTFYKLLLTECQFGQITVR